MATGLTQTGSLDSIKLAPDYAISNVRPIVEAIAAAASDGTAFADAFAPFAIAGPVEAKSFVRVEQRLHRGEVESGK